MTNLTVTINDEILRKAHIRAKRQGTSLNRLLREFLAAYSEGDNTREATRAILQHAKRHSAGSGRGQKNWTREELHER